MPSKLKTVDEPSAFNRRLGIITANANQTGISGAEKTRNLDQTDAAVLALSVFATQSEHLALVIEHPAEDNPFDPARAAGDCS